MSTRIVVGVELYGDRARAESFGGVAERYDRYRPTSPPALFDALVALRPADVLDVACGTGKGAVAMRARGLEVLGVELDPRMAEVARGHGVAVQVAPFESWNAAGRQFDLITCTQGWHWIDPERGLRKAAELLRPGGTMARIWNYFGVDEPAYGVLKRVYAAHAPGADPHGRPQPHEDSDPDDPFAGDPAFDGVQVMRFDWEQTFTAREWVGLVGTFSDHQQLPPDRLAALEAALYQAIPHGLAAHGVAYLVLSRRSG